MNDEETFIKNRMNGYSLPLKSNVEDAFAEYYIIQATHTTDKGTATIYYTETDYKNPWTEKLANAKFFGSYDDARFAKYTYEQWQIEGTAEIKSKLEIKKIAFRYVEEKLEEEPGYYNVCFDFSSYK